MRNQYYVYILQCSDGSYYTGVTNNHEERMNQHQRGDDTSCYTFNRRPLQLKYIATFDDVLQAIAWEKTVKRWTRRKKEALIRGDDAALHALAICKNETHHSNKSVMVSGDEP